MHPTQRPNTRARVRSNLLSTLPFCDQDTLDIDSVQPELDLDPALLAPWAPIPSSTLSTPPESPPLPVEMTSPRGQLAPGSPSKSTAGNMTLNSAASVTLSMEQFNAFLQLIKDANTNAAAAITALTNNSGPPQPTPLSQSTCSAKATSLDSARVTIPKLTNVNFQSWEQAVTQAVTNAGLWKYLDPGVQAPLTTETHEHDIFTQESSSVWTALVSSLDEETNFRYSVGMKSARELWLNLHRHFQLSGDRQLMALSSQFLALSMAEDGNILDHLNEFHRIRRLLAGSDYSVCDHTAINVLLNSLPDGYRDWVSRQRDKASTLTLDDVCASLESEYRDSLRGVAGVGVSAFAVMARAPKSSAQSGTCPIPVDLLPFSGPSTKYPDGKIPALAECSCITCKHCLGTNHFPGTEACPQYHVRRNLWGPHNPPFAKGSKKSNGRSPQANVAETTSTPVVQPSTTAPLASVASCEPGIPFPTFDALASSLSASVADLPSVDCLSTESSTFGGTRISSGTSLIAMVAGDKRHSFLIDSGCQVHLTCLRSVFTKFRTLPTPIQVSGIGGHVVYAIGVGHVSLPVTIGDELHWFELKDVLFAPKLGRNLISVGALVESGLHLGNFNADLSPIYVRGSDTILAYMRYHERLWILDVDCSVMSAFSGVAANVATTGACWHRRLNHIGINALRDLAKTGTIPPLSKEDIHVIQNCGTCVLGKGTRLPFYKSLTPPAVEPLALVHTDLSCIMVPTISGARYLALFLDDYTHMM